MHNQCSGIILSFPKHNFILDYSDLHQSRAIHCLSTFLLPLSKVELLWHKHVVDPHPVLIFIALLQWKEIHYSYFSPDRAQTDLNLVSNYWDIFSASCLQLMWMPLRV